ncbi:superoxide dismutase [Flavobacterium agricola]|uniref:Superoxide dismutase n=1 Tax=Flavobacterium agricola TaxID=2870839 RepID=A0ABY6M3P5_9FLAO|nr:superoxide dismutase [Flavobacterium agricola]UYW01836.1 superoxide dismutase [Flavobacterium agricola]
MKKTILTTSLLSLFLLSCNENKNLQEVAIADATEQTSEVKSYPDPAEVKADGKFQMQGLKYGYSDLNKAIDPETVFIHYSKHHLGYANNLNKAIAGTPQENQTIEEILVGLDVNNATLRNNAGGYYNHNLYWDVLSPTPHEASKEFDEAVKATFGSKDELVKQLKDAAAKQFGSGWSWLVVTPEGKLAVTATANQDNPLMPNAAVKGTPIFGIDVWEHAYYLNYQNKRADYLDEIFNIVDWEIVSENYAKALTK